MRSRVAYSCAFLTGCFVAEECQPTVCFVIRFCSYLRPICPRVPVRNMTSILPPISCAPEATNFHAFDLVSDAICLDEEVDFFPAL